ncbi:MAG: hypothetical protein GX421_01445 [Caldisericales bacterium]|nr:hypothetical protein [Caldisericales bacterium]
MNENRLISIYAVFFTFQVLHIIEEIWGRIYEMPILPFHNLETYLIAASTVVLTSGLAMVLMALGKPLGKKLTFIIAMVSGILNFFVHSIGWIATGNYFAGPGAGTITGVPLFISAIYFVTSTWKISD